ncbi:MAG: hypothetical protein ACK55I_09670, partial [bacterium]
MGPLLLSHSRPPAPPGTQPNRSPRPKGRGLSCLTVLPFLRIRFAFRNRDLCSSSRCAHAVRPPDTRLLPPGTGAGEFGRMDPSGQWRPKMLSTRTLLVSGSTAA